MQREPIIVVVQGGCVTDVLGIDEGAFDVFDWDNFLDNPLIFVEENGGLGSEFFQIIKDLSPNLYDEIKGRFDDAVSDDLEEKLKDPFWMVEAV